MLLLISLHQIINKNERQFQLKEDIELFIQIENIISNTKIKLKIKLDILLNIFSLKNFNFNQII